MHSPPPPVGSAPVHSSALGRCYRNARFDACVAAPAGDALYIPNLDDPLVRQASLAIRGPQIPPMVDPSEAAVESSHFGRA